MAPVLLQPYYGFSAISVATKVFKNGHFFLHRIVAGIKNAKTTNKHRLHNSTKSLCPLPVNITRAVSCQIKSHKLSTVGMHSRGGICNRSHISAKKIKIPHWVTRFGQSGPSIAASWFKYSNGETMSEYAGSAGIRCNQPKASSRVCQGRPHIRLFSIRERPG